MSHNCQAYKEVCSALDIMHIPGAVLFLPSLFINSSPDHLQFLTLSPGYHVWLLSVDHHAMYDNVCPGLTHHILIMGALLLWLTPLSCRRVSDSLHTGLCYLHIIYPNLLWTLETQYSCRKTQMNMDTCTYYTKLPTSVHIVICMNGLQRPYYEISFFDLTKAHENIFIPDYDENIYPINHAAHFILVPVDFAKRQNSL